MTALEVRGLTVAVGPPGRPLFTVEAEAIAAEAGEILALVGESGSGKTSVLETLGLMRPAARLTRYAVAGQDLTTVALGRSVSAGARLRRGRLAYVPQSAAMLPFLDARENALASLRAAGAPVEAAMVADLAERLGVAHCLGARRAELSGGERRRIGLMRGLAAKPRVLLADEPTSALDGASRNLVLEALADTTRADGTTVVIATHDLPGALALGARLLAVETPDREGSPRRLVPAVEPA